MWLFTKIGFMSVVEARKQLLAVRFRDEGDAERFVDSLPKHPKQAVKTQVLTTPDRDYPFRVFVSRKLFASWIAEHVLEGLTYDNFKSEVATRDLHRAHVYGSVWSTLRIHLDPRSQEQPSEPAPSAPALTWRGGLTPTGQRRTG